MHKTKLVLFSIAFVIGALPIQAQIFSAYSQYGLGNMHTQHSSLLGAMGNIGAAYSSTNNVNYTNPAALADVEVTIFDIGLRVNGRTISNQNNAAVNVADAGINNVSFAFPVIKNMWGLSVGLLPYSTAKYKISSTQMFEGDTYTSSIAGKGSLYKFYLGNGFKWKGLKAGISTEFVFGKLENSIYNNFSDNTNNNGSRWVRSMSVRDIVFNAGVQYTATLTKLENQEKGKANLEMTVGAYFSPNLKVDAFVSDYLEATSVSTTGIVYATDTAAGGLYNQYATTNVPSVFGAGVMLGKNNKWQIGLDYDFKSWTKFNNPINSGTMTDEWHLRLGGAITPNAESKKYLSRVTYRLGAHVGKAPIILDNAGVSDFGITFGFGIPVSKFKYLDRSLSNLNLAVEIGALGTNKNQNLVENYYNLVLTYTLSDLWFRKQKFD